MSGRTSERLQTLGWPMYLVAVLLVVFPLADLITNVWPINLGQVQWRFGTVGLLAGFVLTPLLGLVMLQVAAALLDHGVAQRLLAIVSFLGAALLVVAVPLFALDWLQMRSTAPEEALRNLDLGSAKAMVKHVAVAVALLWMGRVGLRLSKMAGRGHREPPPLVKSEKSKDRS